jgi:F0F1-type ATP synthase gamma subunit
MVRQAKRDRLAGKAAAKHHYVERLEKVVRHVVAEYSIAGGGLRNY